MGTEIATARPAPTPQVAKSLSPEQLSEHREKIAFEVTVFMSVHFQPNEAENIRAGQLAWWCDELQDWTREQVLWSLRKWNGDNPRLRPTPGDIVGICKAARGRKIAAIPKPEESPEPRERIDADTANEIMRSAGFAPKRTCDAKGDLR